MNATQMARRAMAAMVKADPLYWSALLQSRLDTLNSSGSIFTGIRKEADLISALSGAYWQEYNHPTLSPDCVGFTTKNIGGKMGVVPFFRMAPGTLVRLVDAKDPGMVSTEVCEDPRTSAGFTVLICGYAPVSQGSTEVELRVFDIHPGHPVRASKVKARMELVGKILRREEAQALIMGLETAKVVKAFD